MVKSTASFTIARLSEEHKPILAHFNCVNDNEFGQYNAKKKKRIADLSKNMNQFLQEEALEEQVNGLNNTFLLVREDRIVGYVSLCADSIKISTKEQEATGVFYETVPALKVARLAVDVNFQRMGFGTKLLEFSIATAIHISNSFCGMKFLTLDCYPHRLDYYTNFGFVTNEAYSADRQSHHPISMRLDIFEYLDKL